MLKSKILMVCVCGRGITRDQLRGFAVISRKAGDRCEAGNICGREEGVEDAMLLTLKMEGSQAIRSSWRRLLLSSAPLDSNLL